MTAGKGQQQFIQMTMVWSKRKKGPKALPFEMLQNVKSSG
jgi:hypothetical protein